MRVHQNPHSVVSIGAGIVYHLSKDELNDMSKLPSKHADGGFESVPMTEVDVSLDTK
jgi:hypothetical protein